MIRFEVAPRANPSPMSSAPFHAYVFDDGTVWTEFYRAGENYVLRFPELADFEVSGDGTRVIAIPFEAIDDATLEHLYINQVQPLALSRQGQPAFHASAVSMSGTAVAFIGRTGLGKSTLAASFALDGTPFLTDDSLIIDETGDTIAVRPSHASLRLWEDSVEAIAGAGHKSADAVSFTSKTRLLAGDALAHVDRPVPVRAAYLLCNEFVESVRFEELEGAARHMAWVENSFLLDIQDRESLSRHFDWTHRISSKIPTFSLDYPREYGMLPTVRNAIADHLNTLSR